MRADASGLLGAIERGLLALWGRDPGKPLVLGLCGAQGSGKSTLAARIVERFEARGIPAASLSLDDLYLPRADRQALAERVHPLLRTRGVPGTHDVARGLSLFAALDRGEALDLPRFDKARDDREARPERHGPGVRLLVFEGWCVGARAEPEAALAQPINALEAGSDADGRWRRYANRALAGAYQTLFARIDLLVLLAAPGFESVERWRIQQERQLRDTGRPGDRIMSDDQVRDFIRHYERLTRHMLAEMPARADIVAWLRDDRSIARLVDRTAILSETSASDVYRVDNKAG